MHFRTIILAVLISGLLIRGSQADIASGIEAYEAGNHDAAYQEWLPEAEGGDAVAQFLLGHLYEEGLGVGQDPVLAYLWYELSASQGDQDAKEALEQLVERMTPEKLEEARGHSQVLMTAPEQEIAEAVETPRALLDDQLADAVLRADTARVAELVAAGASASLRFADGDPLLLGAVKQGKETVALALLGAGAEVDATGEIGWTPLMFAIQGGHEELAAILLRHGADPDRASPSGITARALARDLGVAVPAEPASELEPTAKAAPDPAALFLAAEAGEVTQVEALLAAGVDADAGDSDGWRALMFAAYAGRIEVVRALLASGASVDARSDDGATALMAATLGNQVEIADLLLEQGAKAGQRTADGATALQIAEQNGFTEIAALLRARLGPPPQLVAEVQRLLAALGHDPGPVDGAMGPRTRAAVVDFERARGAAADGRVDEALLAALRETLEAVQARVSAEAEAQERAQLSEQASAEAAWQAIDGTQDTSLYLKYASDYPDSPYAETAQSRANVLTVALLKQDRAAAAAQPVSHQPAARRPAAQAPQVPASAPPQGRPLAAGTVDPQELADWSTVMSSGRPEDFAAYLQAYPQGHFVREANYFMQQQPQAGLGAGQPIRPNPVQNPGPQARPPQDLGPAARYLQDNPRTFHDQLHAYNKQYEVFNSGTQATYRVREVYETIPFAVENGTYKVNVLMGVGNFNGSANDIDLRVERLIVYLQPQNGRFRIVGHSKDLSELPNSG